MRAARWADRFTWMETRSGNRFYPEDPEGSTYTIDDIAHALSMLCRFAGQGDRFYSVAQHCVEVSRAVGSDPVRRRWGLLHDASEAYVVDMPSPVKHVPAMRPYRELEDRITAAIATTFDLSLPEPLAIKRADRRLCRAEAEMLGLLRRDWANYRMAPLDHEIRALGPARAERLFLREWEKVKPR